MKPWAEWFYKGAAWKGTRAAYLASVGWLCERCAARGEVVAAEVVHHRVYLTRANIHDAAIALGWGNLEALCQACHNREHFGGADAAVGYRIGADGRLRESPHADGCERGIATGGGG